jgi:hypothetical protein
MAIRTKSTVVIFAVALLSTRRADAVYKIDGGEGLPACFVDNAGSCLFDAHNQGCLLDRTGWTDLTCPGGPSFVLQHKNQAQESLPLSLKTRHLNLPVC